MYTSLQGQQYLKQVTSSAALTIPAVAKVLQVVAEGGASGGTLTIFGQAITLAVNQRLELRFLHALAVTQPGASANGQITATSTVTAVVEYVAQGASLL